MAKGSGRRTTAPPRSTNNLVTGLEPEHAEFVRQVLEAERLDGMTVNGEASGGGAYSYPDTISVPPKRDSYGPLMRDPTDQEVWDGRAWTLYHEIGHHRQMNDVDIGFGRSASPEEKTRYRELASIYKRFGVTDDYMKNETLPEMYASVRTGKPSRWWHDLPAGLDEALRTYIRKHWPRPGVRHG